MILQFSIPGTPRTKKNSPMLVKGRSLILPSQAYRDYERDTAYLWRREAAILMGKPLSGRYNVRLVYYMPTRRRCDLVNLMEASLDLMVEYGILADDHSGIVASHDGSAVRIDKENPRVEIEITESKEAIE